MGIETQGIDPKIIEKIQKLINLKEGAEAIGSVHEAENASTRLQEFLLKYNLDLDAVKKSKIEAKAEMDTVGIDVGDMQDKRESNWVPELYKAVAENMLCHVVITNTYIKVLGHKHNVQLVLYIAEQLVAKVRIAEKGAWSKYTGDEKRGTFRRGFLKGCGIGIRRRLQEEKSKMERDKEHNPMAVMIINKEAELKEYLYEKGIMRRPLTPEQIAENEAYWAKLEQEEQKRIAAMTPKELEKYQKQQAREEARWRREYTKRANKKGPRGLSSNDGYSMGREAGENMSINKGLNDSPIKGNIS